MLPIDSFAAGLPGALHDAVGADALLAATEPPPGGAIERVVGRDQLSIGGRLLESPIPRVSLRLPRSVDAAELAAAWGIDAPIAVSPGAHQATWRIAGRGPALADPATVRVVAEDVVAGCWVLRAVLEGRPPGPLPQMVAGASPAYPLVAGMCRVVRIDVERRPVAATLGVAGDPGAVAVLEAARRRHPHARPGWTPDAADRFLVVREGGVAAAGAAVELREGRTFASAIALDPSTATAAAVAADLVDALEAVALGNAAPVLRLDGTAFLVDGPLRLADRGYVVGPPYDGDADVEVWAERRVDADG